MRCSVSRVVSGFRSTAAQTNHPGSMFPFCSAEAFCTLEPPRGRADASAGRRRRKVCACACMCVCVYACACACACACMCMRGPASTAASCSSLGVIGDQPGAPCHARCRKHGAVCKDSSPQTPSHATAARRARSRASTHVISVRAAGCNPDTPAASTPHAASHCAANAPRMPVHDARSWSPRSPL